MAANRQGMVSTFASASLVGLALLAGVLWLLGNNPAQVHACSCVEPGTPSEELEKFSAVFAGKVVSVQHSYDPNAASVTPEDRTTVGFEVSAVWKGTVHEDMYISTPPTGGSCGFTFSDLTQRLLPAIVLNAYPVQPVDPNTALKIAHEMEATPPFQDGAL